MRPPSLSSAFAVALTLPLSALASAAHPHGGSHHLPSHPQQHGSRGVFARDARAESVLVDRAAEWVDERAVEFEPPAGTSGEGYRAVVGSWTADDDLWVSEGRYADSEALAERDLTQDEQRDQINNKVAAADLANKLLINPKWIALNPKWKPTNGTSTAAKPSTAPPSPAISASKTASAATTTKSTVGGSLVLPAPPASTCATPYYGVAGTSAVYGPGLGDFPMLPRPSTFVKRSGNKLVLDGETYRIVGPNIYWLGLDENVYPSPSYPSHGRIREAMAITVALGGNTIRSHTLGISTGNSYSLWPSAWKTNNKAFDTIDYSIWAARNYGLRLIIPLTDNYAYYQGGKYDFIGWAGADTSDGSQFYTNSAVIELFKGYIKVLLTHVNQYTGVALKDDPTILAWETGNELGGYMLGGGAPPASWTKSIATYIKSLAPNHLVADGSDGLTNYNGDLANTGVGVSKVDLVTDHFYPALQWLLEKDQGWMKSISKNFFVGENDWTGQKGGSDLNTFYATIESWDGSGSMMWSIFGHDDYCCNYVNHNDGYTLMYPNGNTQALRTQAWYLMQHWYRMRGLTPPAALPAVACPQPELLP
ncbi:RHTO0S03e00562g1_1 [Rhodotorula toruloides]|uniref:mannan endo-1,4-beta-mannosidase n=1 Tax=Rhodotorula toruloides TaxID=5286 RepID=A0A061AR94_RHOTO|nr:RHTO0S03e00562g1_1 [Rhodotorula toruloides]